MSEELQSDFYSQEERKRLRTRLRNWYHRTKRDLPWRATHDPYRIWLSEIMLQQTTVAAVIPYYERFLQQFPTVFELADAEEADVLRLWEGLGYYSRARNIHKTARRIAKQNGGEFPPDPKSLQQLPGIGRYTAGAIASFAFDKPAPIVEANTQRLYARLLGFGETLQSSLAQKRLWQFAEELVPSRKPGTFNQALMELGSQICQPTEPDCDGCPISAYCAAYQEGRQGEIPQPKAKIEMTEVTHLCVALKKGANYLVQQYEAGDRWAGLWDFLRWEQNDFPVEPSPLTKRGPKKQKKALFSPRTLHEGEFAQVEDFLVKKFALQGRIQDRTMKIRHGVTRYRITLLCYEAEYVEGSEKHLQRKTRWASPEELAELPLSKTGRKFAGQLLGNGA